MSDAYKRDKAFGLDRTREISIFPGRYKSIPKPNYTNTAGDLPLSRILQKIIMIICMKRTSTCNNVDAQAASIITALHLLRNEACASCDTHEICKVPRKFTDRFVERGRFRVCAKSMRLDDSFFNAFYLYPSLPPPGGCSSSYTFAAYLSFRFFFRRCQ